LLHCRLVAVLVRRVAFGGAFAGGKVHLGDHLGMHVLAAEQRREDVFDARW
jgi:hypothetical protein